VLNVAGPREQRTWCLLLHTATTQAVLTGQGTFTVVFGPLSRPATLRRAAESIPCGKVLSTELLFSVRAFDVKSDQDRLTGVSGGERSNERTWPTDCEVDVDTIDNGAPRNRRTLLFRSP
jgi:hypothetical protein